MSTLRLRGLTHHYGELTALDDVSLELRPGVTGLVGLNGAGKTTLLHAVAGALRPSHGSVALVGDDGSVLTARQLAASCALMPQSFVVPVRVRARDFLSYVAWLREVPRGLRRDRVEEVLGLVGLADRARDRLGDLSGGMVRRLLLAQALLAEPRVLLLDEPTTGLDPDQRAHVRDLVRGLSPETVVLLSSHILEDVVALAERTVMIDEGRIVFDDSTAAFRELGAAVVAGSPRFSAYEAAFLHLREGER